MRICDAPALTEAKAAREATRPGADNPMALSLGRLCGGLSQVLVLALVCVLPWWYGGVEPLAQFVCGCLVFVATGLMLAAGVLGVSSASAPRAMLLVLFFAMGLGALQLIPLPGSTLSVVAPENALLWQRLAGSQEPSGGILAGLDAGPGLPRTWPISLFAASTRNDLALLCVGSAMFALGAFQFANDRAILTLLATVSIGGAALAFFGIAQQLTWNGKIFGVTELRVGGSPFASFVNRNNAGGFLNLCLAASLGLLVWSSGRSVPRPGRVRGWRAALADLTGLQLLAILVTITVLGAVFCSLSRGAILACLLAFAILVLARPFSQAHRGWVLASGLVVASGAVGLTAWVGRIDEVQQRTSSLSQVLSQPDGRWGHWRDSLEAGTDFWFLGSGLGTHRFVYRLYERFPVAACYHHAENQYVEAFVEGGLVGLGLLVTAAGLTVIAGWRLVKDDSDLLSRALGVTGLFAISSQAIHAFFDFGLYLPANMCLLALLGGVVHGRGADSSRRAPGTGHPAKTFLDGRAARLSTTTALCVLLVLAGKELWAQARVDALTGSLPEPSAAGEIGSDPGVLAAWETATRVNPDDAEVRLQAAQAWVDRYRHEAWQSLVAQHPEGEPDQLWMLTSPVEVLAHVRGLERSRRTIEAENFRASRGVRDNLVPAVRHLEAARAACPLLPDVHLLLSELHPIISPRIGAGAGVERVSICAPRHGQLLAEAGLVALLNSHHDLAALIWQSAGTVEPQRLPSLLRLAASQTAMRPYLGKMLPQDVALLLHVARESFMGAEDHDLRVLVTQQAKTLLPAATIDQSQRWHLEGVLLWLEGRPAAAIERLTKASQQRPLEVPWRFDLAAALADQGQTEQARDHASFCARMDPQNPQYTALLKKLIRSSLSN